MLKKSASGVLASFRPSTYPRGYAFGPSLAAALLDELFEHPAGSYPVVPTCGPLDFRRAGHDFPSLLDFALDRSFQNKAQKIPLVFPLRRTRFDGRGGTAPGKHGIAPSRGIHRGSNHTGASKPVRDCRRSDRAIREVECAMPLPDRLEPSYAAASKSPSRLMPPRAVACTDWKP